MTDTDTSSPSFSEKKCRWTYPTTQGSIEEAASAYARKRWLRGLVKDTGGAGLCVDVTRHFLEYLFRCGLLDRKDEGRTWAYGSFDLKTAAYRSAFDGAREPLHLEPDARYPNLNGDLEWPRVLAWHCVPVVHGVVYDFTARQFDEELPFPFVWKAVDAAKKPE